LFKAARAASGLLNTRGGLLDLPLPEGLPLGLVGLLAVSGNRSLIVRPTADTIASGEQFGL
jgi:hypothetical protein